MGKPYTVTYAPSELVSHGLSVLGFECEAPIVQDYLRVTKGSMQPNNQGYPHDWWDDANKYSYIDIMMTWFGLSRDRLLADSRIKGKLRWPDIATFRGLAYPPPAGAGPDPRRRNEFYDIKPNSETGRRDADQKIYDLRKQYRRYQVPLRAGRAYPEPNPKYIQLTWGRVFEVARRHFMRRNHLKRADVDLEVLRSFNGQLLYKIRFTFEMEDDLTKKLAEDFAEGLMWALATAAAAAVLAFGAAWQAAQVGVTVAGALWEAAKLLTEAGAKELMEKAPPTALPRIRIAPDVVEQVRPLSDAFEDAMQSRGYGLPGEEHLLCCEESYFQNVILDRQAAAQAAELMRVRGYERWAAYASGRAAWTVISPRVEKAAWLLDPLHLIFPDSTTVRNAVRRLAAENPSQEVGLSSVVLVGTAAVLGYAAPEMVEASFTRQRPGEAHPDLPNGMYAMPSPLLAKSIDGRYAAGAGAAGLRPTRADVLKQLVTGPVEESRLKYLLDVVNRPDVLRKGLLQGAGFTIATAVHGIYRNIGRPKRPEDSRFGELVDFETSRMFLVPAGASTAGIGMLNKFDAARYAAGRLGVSQLPCRYLGRLRVR